MNKGYMNKVTMLVSVSADIHWPQARTLSGANLMVLSKRETVLNMCALPMLVLRHGSGEGQFPFYEPS